MEVLKLENLSKFYTSENSVVVGLTGINLTFSTGELVALTGESGSGKSTLAHVLGGILPYESGELYIYGQPTSHYDSYDWSRYRRDLISFISQSYGILPGNTVEENIESALRMSGLEKDEASLRAADILKEVELGEFRKRKAGKLSSGQKQRLSIARALAKPSKILIADEPTGNLDRENSEKVIELLKRASKDRLIILITHEFEEVKDVATRRIILSDGAVVTDAALAQTSAIKPEITPPKSNPTKKAHKPLSPYVCGLTIKSRPIFTSVLIMLLAVTMFISFVFVGNFIIALDDTSTKIYNSEAFINGSPERLVVMRADGEDLSGEDYKNIMGVRYVESIDRFGYSNDLIYHYKYGIDHIIKDQVVLGPDYNEVLNPGDYSVEEKVQLYNSGYLYFRTLPYIGKDIISDGRAAEGAYEIVSADPEYKTGDVVRVYLRNEAMWSIGTYFQLDLKVVGTTDFGEGLYFSDKLASALTNSSYPLDMYAPYNPWGIEFIYAPFDPELIPIAPGYPEVVELEDDQYIAPTAANRDYLPPFNVVKADGEMMTLNFTSLHKGPPSNIMFVSDATFDKTVRLTSNQSSVYIRDYSYTERVLDSLTEKGYIAISPYQLGATEVDEELARERIITLAVCLVTFVIAVVLQCILLRTMFASLFEYYRLMSNTGLTAGVATAAVAMTLLFATLAGEALGAAAIYVLNSANVERVVNIFKYLDLSLIIILFSLHLITVLISLLGILSSLKRSVFGGGKSGYDIDFTLMEEEA